VRIGLGFDAHRFDSSRPLVLGGVTIPDVPGLAGHSDADIVSHALADALLGAANLGDLGALFPATDQWRDASSLEILRAAAARVVDDGWMIANVDVTIVCERPRLSSWRSDMMIRVADTLEIDARAVSIKATTTDGLGFTGRGEGAAAIAVVLLEEAPASTQSNARERERR
jgi:2-C-methyl-D-erythritol 2,4-cyclodiphosphate synthase